MRLKHPRLDKNEVGQLIFYCPTQTKARNTESLYIIEANELYMAGVKVEKHPKFKDIVQFENWCNVYWVKHYTEE
jgi:hypothetical protein